MILSLEFPRAQVGDLDQIHELVDELCHRVQMEESICYALRLCIEEAFVNVVDHGYSPEQPGFVTISLKTMDHTIHALIGDRAPSFHPEHAPKPNLDLDWDQREIGGLGWHFIREMMDEVRYEADEEKGNCLTLVKYLDPARETKKGRLEITISTSDEVTLVSLGGRVDALAAPSVNEMLAKQLAAGKKDIVADVERMNYISSAGVFALLHALKQARALGGDLRVASASKQIHRILELSGFFDLARHFNDVDSAVKSFR